MKRFLYLLIFLSCFYDINSANLTPIRKSDNKQLWNATWTDKLKKDLLLHYDKFSRPAQHTNSTIVTLDLNLKHVDLDEMNSVMTVFAWVKMYWADEKLKWNASDYGGLTRLHLADHEIWQPDIVLYNSASGSEVDHYGNTHSIVYQDGTVLWVPPAQFKAFCDIDLRHWPFDEQTCTLRLGSWTYDGDQVDLQVDDKDVENPDPDSDWSVNNAEWQLIELTKQRNLVYYECCTEGYIDVTYTLTLQRKSPSYGAVVITPTTVVVLLTLATFWLPPNAGEKIILNSFLLLIICVLLLSFNNKLPAMANHTPLIVLFYSNSFIMVTFAILTSILVINIARYPRKTPLPWFIRQFLNGKFGRILCTGVAFPSMQTSGNISTITGEELRDTSGGDNINEDQLNIISNNECSMTIQKEWFLLAMLIDRIMFCLYSLIFLILAIAYV